MNIKDLSPDSIVKNTNSLSSLSPYIGRLRPECADYLITRYADPRKLIFDPFCGSGTVLLQGWIAGYSVVGNDLNPYAYTLSMGKMNPYTDEVGALNQLKAYRRNVARCLQRIDYNSVPQWIKDFYNEKTLQEIIAWTRVLKYNHEWFLLSCLLGILHHQRPGFLSYPASHGAPYLRVNKYPREQFPEMYEYRNVYEKLSKKVQRAYRNFPQLDYNINRIVYNKNAATMLLRDIKVGTIITSPPYMRALTYARDNRLRLWFLGEQDWESLDKIVSPGKGTYSLLMKRCFSKWARHQEKGDKCVVIIGDMKFDSKNSEVALAEHIEEISKKDYKLVEAFQDPIPESHKLVKGHANIKREIIVALERK